MNELTPNFSLHILEIPQHNPFFYPIEFLGWIIFDPSWIKQHKLGRRVQTLFESIEWLK